MKREKTPFVFTPEMAHVFGGRRHLHLLVSLLLLMIPAEMPELRDRDDISYIVEVSTLEKSDEEAAASFDALIIECMNNTFKRIDNTLHIWKHK